MILLHHLENSRSQRILWLLEELELPYNIRQYRRDPDTSLAPPELLAVHPLGKSPVITDGERTLAESGAIIEHLVETYGHGRLVPTAGSAAHFAYRYAWPVSRCGRTRASPRPASRCRFSRRLRHNARPD